MKKNQDGFGVIEIVLIVAAVIILAALGWITLHAISNKHTEQVSLSDATTPTKTRSDDDTSISKVGYYQVTSQRIEIKTDDDTKDIQASEDGNIIYFTLTGFLNNANTSGYSLTLNGVNNCERLAGITIFKNVDEVRAQGNAVTGDLVDENGNPIQDRVIKLKDGRYAELFNHQASCGNESSDESPLRDQETAANAAIRRVITNSLQSY